MEHCILCHSSHLRVLQRVKVTSIANLYKSKFNIDVTAEFSGKKKITFKECHRCKLTFVDPELAGSEIFYEQLQKNDDQYYAEKRPEFLAALKHLKPNTDVLEIGSGSAYFASMLQDQNYVGLEYNDEAIRKAREKGVKLLKESIEDHAKINIQAYGAVCSFHVLEHVQNPKTFIENSLAVLKKDGLMIIAVPCANSLFTSNINHVLNMPPHHISRWKAQTMDYIMQEYKLELVNAVLDKVTRVNDYKENRAVKKIIKFFTKKEIYFNPFLVTKLQYVVKKLNRRFKFLKPGNEYYYGKNMIYIFRKK